MAAWLKVTLLKNGMVSGRVLALMIAYVTVYVCDVRSWVGFASWWLVGTDLIAKIRRNPLKRALRVDKMTIAALSAVLRLYTNPERLAERLPALRALTRPVESVRRMAEQARDAVAARVSGFASVEVIACESQIGSGALPVAGIASAGLAIRPVHAKGNAPERLAAAFRALPRPVIGRVQDGALVLDFRCLEDCAAFTAQIGDLIPPAPQSR